MKTNTIVCVTEMNSREVAIVVETTHADSLHDFLKKKNVDCSGLPATVFRAQRFFQDSPGSLAAEPPIYVREFTAYGTLKDFDYWIGEWFRSTPAAKKS